MTEGPLSLDQAIDKVKSFKGVKFDQTVECVLLLGIDPKQTDQLIRGSLSLPHGVGKQKKVIGFCDESQVEAAKKAGAIEAGVDELVKKVMDGWADFDVAIASPKVMGKVGKLGRVLGPQGKMPSPKNGTVTDDVTTAVAEFTAGKIEFRNDAGGNVHAVVGKQSFDKQKLRGEHRSVRQSHQEGQAGLRQGVLHPESLSLRDDEPGGGSKRLTRFALRSARSRTRLTTHRGWVRYRQPGCTGD